MTKLIPVITLLIILGLGCGNHSSQAGPAPQSEAVGPQAVETKPVPPGAELFTYRWGGGDLGFMGGGDQGEVQLVVADVVTGETQDIYPFDKDRQIIFSPDYSTVLYLDAETDPPGTSALAVNRASGEELWQIPLTQEDGVPQEQYHHANWDIERGYIILEGIGISKNENPETNASPFGGFSWWFLTLDMATGKELARLKIMDNAPVRIIPVETQAGAQYAGGKLFLPLPDYPVTNLRSFGRYDTESDFNIYAIDPITGEGTEINMQGELTLPIEARFFPTSDASQLYVQTSELSQPGSPQLMGGSIQRIDLATGKWEMIVAYDKSTAYGLRGMTPDGSRILFSKRILHPEGAIDELEIVRDMSTGNETEIPVSEGVQQLWISPSGKYVVSFVWSKMPEILVHDVDSGTQRILDAAETGHFPYPLGFLGGLGNGL